MRGKELNDNLVGICFLFFISHSISFFFFIKERCKFQFRGKIMFLRSFLGKHLYSIAFCIIYHLHFIVLDPFDYVCSVRLLEGGVSFKALGLFPFYMRG